MSKTEVSKPGKKIATKMQGASDVWFAVGILALAFLVGELATARYLSVPIEKASSSRAPTVGIDWTELKFVPFHL